MFSGLSAFPLTPLRDSAVDESSFTHLVTRLADAGVDSITALGSTGCYPYLTRQERARVARLAVENAAGVPVIIGVGALRTGHVLELVEDAQEAGASGVLLPPLSYQALTADDVYGLYEDVTRELAVPLVVYDNPGTTHFTFTDDLYQALAALPHVASLKIPGVPADPARAAERVARLRDVLPAGTAVGVSGDAFGAIGLNAGCDCWYSVIGGTLPRLALDITRAAQAGDRAAATSQSDRLVRLWDLFAEHGSLRVTAAIAEHLGLAAPQSLPLPIRGLAAADRADAVAVCTELRLTI